MGMPAPAAMNLDSLDRHMKFEFTGWREHPLDLFDAKQWSKCLHAAIQAYNFIGDPQYTQAALEDTGLLHELAHLSVGINIWTHHNLDDLRAELARVINRV